MSNKQFACLLGHPVAHSISPRMHNEAFRLCNIDAEYVAVDATADTLGTVMSDIRNKVAAGNYLGSNITMPLKTEIMQYLDELDISAKLANSVNTIVNVDGRLIGHTTDGGGYVDSLREIGVSVQGLDIVILGAGGAATSVIVTCALEGARSIKIARRYNERMANTLSFADAVCNNTSCEVSLVDIEDSSALSAAIDSCDLLINATPIGMIKEDGSADSATLDVTPVPKEMLRPDLVVTDLIYEPAMTKLLRDAEEIGCKYMNGKFMLLYQGARSFKLWTGVDMPTEIVKKKYFM